MANILNNVKENKNVPERCYNTAIRSDDIFKKIANNKGLLVENASFEHDMHDHIDYYVTLNGVKFPVDIKSSKKTLQITRREDILNEWIWIELKNVHGKLGWLYGKATYIVYVFNDCMWFINRRKLTEFIASKVTKVFSDKSNAHYKLYQRKDRKDILTYVQLGDIMDELHPVVVTL